MCLRIFNLRSDLGPPLSSGVTFANINNEESPVAVGEKRDGRTVGLICDCEKRRLMYLLMWKRRM